MKKLWSTAYGRLGAMLLIVIVFVFVRSILDRVIPLQVLQAVKSGKMRVYTDGSALLPWYWRFETASGAVYVTHDTANTYVVFPQETGGETRFTGLMATDKVIVVGKTDPCNQQNSCESLVTPTVAQFPREGTGSNLVTIDGEVAPHLYAVENNAE
jgi:hypothetical protein